MNTYLLDCAHKVAQLKAEQICHYTSLETVQKIFSNKELWAFGADCMNDTKEVYFYLQGLEKALLDDEDLAIHKIEIHQFFDKIYCMLKDNFPFILCISRRKDDAGMYYQYADGGKGCCIVFNTMQLIQTFRGYLINEVFYGFIPRNERHFTILKTFYSTGELLDNFYSLESYTSNLLATASLLKHESFRAEDEIRVAELCWIPKEEITHNTIRDNMGRSRQVIKISLEKLCHKNGTDLEDLVDEIILGPCSDIKIEDFQEQILSMGYGKLAKKIRLSNCPMRKNG